MVGAAWILAAVSPGARRCSLPSFPFSPLCAVRHAMSRQLLTMALAPPLGLFILGIGNGFLSTVITLRLDAAGESAVVIGWVSSAYFIGLALGAMLNDRLLLRIGHIRAYGSFASLVAVTVLLQGLEIGRAHV